MDFTTSRSLSGARPERAALPTPVQIGGRGIADLRVHPHGLPALDLVEIDDFGTAKDAQMHGFAGRLVQPSQMRFGNCAELVSGPGTRSKHQQAKAKRIGVVAVEAEQAFLHEIGKLAVQRAARLVDWARMSVKRGGSSATRPRFRERPWPCPACRSAVPPAVSSPKLEASPPLRSRLSAMPVSSPIDIAAFIAR